MIPVVEHPMGPICDQAPGQPIPQWVRHRALWTHLHSAAAGWAWPKVDRLVCLGDDPNGRPLEVMAVGLADGDVLVIHTMPLREKYRGNTWRR